MDTCGIGDTTTDPVTARQDAWCVYFELIDTCKGAELEIDELKLRIEEEMNSSPSPNDLIMPLYRYTRLTGYEPLEAWEVESALFSLHHGIKLPHPDFDRLPDVDSKETDVCFSESLTAARDSLNDAIDALEHERAITEYIEVTLGPKSCNIAFDDEINAIQKHIDQFEKVDLTLV
jgi:hypothetical protein